MLMNTASVSNSFCKARLMSPIFGLASMIHETVNRMPGMTSGTIVSAKNSALNGVLVRSFIQARPVPTKRASTAAPEANCTELMNRRAVSVLKYAMRKFSSVNCAGAAAVCGVRMLCQSRKTSGTRASHAMAAIDNPITMPLNSIRGAISGRETGNRPARALVMLVMLVMIVIMIMVMPMIMMMVMPIIVMVNALGWAAATRVLAEQQ